MAIYSNKTKKLCSKVVQMLSIANAVLGVAIIVLGFLMLIPSDTTQELKEVVYDYTNMGVITIVLGIACIVVALVGFCAAKC